MPLVTLKSISLVLVVCGATILGAAIGLTASSDKTRSLADYIASICAAHFRDASHEEATFLAENVSAMSKMMVDMSITPSGDVDRDFVAMMAPHHQGAIAMAQSELRYGRNERLRRMAQEIIVTQQQEISAMRLATREAWAPSAASELLTPATGDVRSELR